MTAPNCRKARRKDGPAPAGLRAFARGAAPVALLALLLNASGGGVRARQAPPGPARPAETAGRAGTAETPGAGLRPDETRMLNNLKAYQFRQLRADVEARRAYWSRADFSNLTAYNRSVAPARPELLDCIGVPEELRRDQKTTLTVSRLVRATEDMYLYHWVLSLNDLGLRAEALIAIPRKRRPPYPVVVGYYGSAGSPEKVFGLEEATDYHKKFGLTLVRAGYCVYVPYLVMSRMDAIDAAGISRDMRLIGLEIGLSMRALDYLSARTYIDRDRFSVFGVSWGGTLSRYLGACDPRIRVTLVSSAFSDTASAPTRDFLDDPTLYYLSYDYLRRFDPVTLSYLIAPRALFIEHGAGDNFTKNRVQAGYEKVRAIYERLGASEKVGFEKGSGGHEVYLHRSLDFLKRWCAPALPK
jgi:hypothetical protein